MAHPTYFVADIAANHDGSLDRALSLIHLAKESGADAAKFQHFTASKIVSDHGFKKLGSKSAHQAAWEKSVVEVYEDASVPGDWTPILYDECRKIGITFLSTPYDLETVDHLDPYVDAFKIGSGDIDWLEEIEHIAQKGKPILLATGASTLEDVEQAANVITSINPQLILMQCNTNYTNSESNFDHLHLKVLETFASRFPNVVLGLSDHTHGPAAVLGAVTLGARVVERHFTDDNDRQGPDHAFALDPMAWRTMVAQTRQLERALGSSVKDIAGNEIESAVVQRRCLRANRDLEFGDAVLRGDLAILRPATPGAIRPAELQKVIGRRVSRSIRQGEELRWADFLD